MLFCRSGPMRTVEDVLEADLEDKKKGPTLRGCDPATRYLTKSLILV